MAGKVTGETMHTAVELAAAADLIAGYGPVKDAGVAAYRARVAELLPALGAPKVVDASARETETA